MLGGTVIPRVERQTAGVWRACFSSWGLFTSVHICEFIRLLGKKYHSEDSRTSLKIKGGAEYGTTLHTELPSGKGRLHLHMPEELCWEALAEKWGISVVVQILTLCFPI